MNSVDRNVINEKRKTKYHIVKRSFDIVFSLILIPLLLVVSAVVAVAIRSESNGTIFYVHERMGKDSRKFRLYKFRSMLCDADEKLSSLNEEQLKEWKENFKLIDDPRVTRVGSFLRKTSLDELPQLLNILKGEMSFVGPRPITEEELSFYGNKSTKLLSIVPGLTGYWQAYARNTCSYSHRVDMEMYYVEHASLLLDLKILFATVSRVLSQKGAV